jgi:hypothetical protein
MKIKETIIREYDEHGRVIKRTSTVVVLDENRGYDERCGFSRFGDFQRSSNKRIREAYEDYRMSEQW